VYRLAHFAVPRKLVVTGLAAVFFIN